MSDDQCSPPMEVGVEEKGDLNVGCLSCQDEEEAMALGERGRGTDNMWKINIWGGGKKRLGLSAEKAFQCCSINIQDNRGETQGRQTTCPNPAMDPHFLPPTTQLWLVAATSLFWFLSHPGGHYQPVARREQQLETGLISFPAWHWPG